MYIWTKHSMKACWLRQLKAQVTVCIVERVVHCIMYSTSSIHKIYTVSEKWHRTVSTTSKPIRFWNCEKSSSVCQIHMTAPVNCNAILRSIRYQCGRRSRSRSPSVLSTVCAINNTQIAIKQLSLMGMRPPWNLNARCTRHNAWW